MLAAYPSRLYLVADPRLLYRRRPSCFIPSSMGTSMLVTSIMVVLSCCCASCALCEKKVSFFVVGSEKGLGSLWFSWILKGNENVDGP